MNHSVTRTSIEMITPAPTRPSPIVRTSRGARRESTTSATMSATRCSAQSASTKRAYRRGPVQRVLREEAVNVETAHVGGRTERSSARGMRLRRATRRPKRLALRPFLCASPSSPMSTLTRTHSSRCSRRSTRGAPTRSGVSATRSATDRRRTGAASSCRSAPTSASSATTTWSRWDARRRGLQRRGGRGSALDARRARAALARVLVGARAERRRRRRAAVSRERARPRLGVRDQRRDGIRQPADLSSLLRPRYSTRTVSSSSVEPAAATAARAASSSVGTSIGGARLAPASPGKLLESVT